MSALLIDTDILINLLRGAGKAKLYVENAAYEMNVFLATGNGKHYPMSDIRKEVIPFDEEGSH